MSMCGKHIGLRALRQASVQRHWSIAQNKYSTKVSSNFVSERKFERLDF